MTAAWRRNEPIAARRRCALRPAHKVDGHWAPLATDFAGAVYIRLGDATWISASGTLTNTGIDGEWLYEATQDETDRAVSEIAVRVDDGTYDALTLVSVDHGAADIWQRVLDANAPANAQTAEQILNLLASWGYGPKTESADGSVTIRDPGDTKDRITGNVVNGARALTGADGS